MEINCNYCKVKFERTIQKINLNKKRGCKNYCSRECYFRSKYGKSGPWAGKKRSEHSKIISGKNNPMYGKKRPLHSKRMVGENNPFYGKRHTEEFIERLTGKNHWNWKGGITAENMKERLSFKNRGFIQKILKQDNYTCQACDQNGGKLEVDHIMPWSLYPNLRCVQENVRILCKSCHVKYGANPRRRPIKWAISPIDKNG